MKSLKLQNHKTKKKELDLYFYSVTCWVELSINLKIEIANKNKTREGFNKKLMKKPVKNIGILASELKI